MTTEPSVKAASRAIDRKTGDMQEVRAENLVQLDRQLEEMCRKIEAQRELLRRHLENPGVNPAETAPAGCEISLNTAGEILNCVSDRNLLARTKSAIQEREKRQYAGKEDATTPEAEHARR